jgi:hypothetical protein
MAKITKVPDGPLVKKKGPFKGSTLKNGGAMKKKAQTGMDVPKPKTGEHTGAPIGEYKPQGPSVGKYGGEGAPIGVSKYAKKGFKTGGTVKKAQLGTLIKKGAKAVGLGTAAAAGASSASSCSSGHCFHKKSRWTHNGRRKNGGKVKKAQNGTTTTPAKKSWFQMSPSERTAKQAEVKSTRGREGFGQYMDSIRNANFQKNADVRGLTVDQLRKANKKDARKPDVEEGLKSCGNETTGCSGSQRASERRVKREANRKNGGPVKKAMLGSSIFKDNPIYKKTTDLRGKLGSAALGMPGMKPIVKNGKMIKRADGSTSKRGLWDNIRANKGSGKKPTAAMLKQEKKIKAKK